VAGREGKRGECQTRLGLVWRETGAVRNARPSRVQAASTRKRAKWSKDAKPLLHLHLHSSVDCWFSVQIVVDVIS